MGSDLLTGRRNVMMDLKKKWIETQTLDLCLLLIPNIPTFHYSIRLNNAASHKNHFISVKIKKFQDFYFLVRRLPVGTILLGKNDQLAHIPLPPASGLNFGIVF